MGSEQGKIHKILGLVLFLSLSFLIALASVWYMVLKNDQEMQAETLPAGNAEAALQENTQPDSVFSQSAAADSIVIQPGSSGTESPLDSLKAFWEQEKKAKLKSYLNILKRQSERENENLARIKALAQEKDSLARQINMVQQQRDISQGQLQQYKNNIAPIIADEVVSYYKSRDARQDSIDEARRKEELASTGAGIRKVAKIFESMRPEEAASVIAELTDDEIISILFKMRERTAAKIIAEFKPLLAVRITRKMSEQ